MPGVPDYPYIYSFTVWLQVDNVHYDKTSTQGALSQNCGHEYIMDLLAAKWPCVTA